ncbi:MAG: hypothetical protein RDU20_21370 [Desulfomonilaceae bacterium]|nr:hypothetical protein [Desulfomonilaceae bacterium]
MRRKIFVFIVGLLLTVLVAIPATAAEVAQGKCLSFDTEKNKLMIEEYDTNVSKEHPYGRPTGKQMTFDTSKALIGIAPAVGDVMRIAYTPRGEINHAIRIMNVSKQDLMKK